MEKMPITGKNKKGAPASVGAFYGRTAKKLFSRKNEKNRGKQSIFMKSSFSFNK